MDNIVVPPYSKKVLIGNWVDRRYAFDEKTSGILPGLSPSDQCEKLRTLSQDTYTNAAFSGGDCKQYFKEKHVTRVRNFYAGTTSNVKLMDTTELKNNYTTTNTLVFDLLPRLREELRAMKAQPERGIPEHQQNVDMLQCFGNRTKTHDYAKHFKCQRQYEDSLRMRTTYGSAYNHC